MPIVNRKSLALISGGVILAAAVTVFVVVASQPETHTCTEWLEVKGYDPDESEGLICSMSDTPEGQELTEEEFNEQAADMANMFGDWADQLEDS